ncbi:DUF3971 domain-containing protein [Helicobacter mehlei]|uniref:DUF3971 domain-containing protein n=1 Tax=Helicobacter mehlei TaxID=2316080 RepID=A0A553USN3_9HELI|nr:DUF3971 domain-containing protein [Helicobacter mehlei]
MEQFYLKLDNKFLLELGSLDISALLKPHPHKKPPPINQIVQGIRSAIIGLGYFKRIDLKEIVFTPKIKARVRFDGANFAISLPGWVESRMLLQDQGDLHLKILKLHVIPYRIHASGDVFYHVKSNKLDFYLRALPMLDISRMNLRASNLIASIKGQTDFKNLSLSLSTNEFHHLDFLKPYIPHKFKATRTWIFDRVQFSSLQIKEAHIGFSLKTKHALPSILERLRVRALVKEARVHFNPLLPPILSKEVWLELKNKNLYMEPKNIFYDGMALEGSRVQIDHLEKNQKLKAQIKIAPNTAYKRVKNLLKGYDIPLPIQDLQSKISADLLLNVQFRHQAHALLSMQGTIQVQQGSFLLYNTPLFSQNTQITLDIQPDLHRLYIQTQHTRYLNIADVDANITLDFTHKRLSSQAKIHKLQFNTNNTINTSPFDPNRSMPAQVPQHPLDLDSLGALIAKGTRSKAFEKKILEQIQSQNQETFSQDVIYATPKNLPTLSFSLDFSKPNILKIKSQQLQLEAQMAQKTYVLQIRDLSKIAPISPLLRYFAVYQGAVQISTQDFKRFNFVSSNLGIDLPLYRHDGGRLSSFAFLGTIQGDMAEIFSLDGSVMAKIQGGERMIFLKNIDFNLDEFLNSKMPAIKELLTFKQHTQPTLEQARNEEIFIRAKQRYEKRHQITPDATIINATNSVLTFKTLPLIFDSVRLVARDGRVKADAMYDRAMVNLDIVHANLHLKASNFSGDYINMALQGITSKNLIEGGLYTLAGTYQDNAFNGQLTFQNTVVKNFKVLQNVINVINTIPSLIAFRNPRLGVNGYEILKGRVIFGGNDDFIGIEKVQLTGATLDVDGSGIINLKSRKIDAVLNVSTIKAISNIINKIPIVNYLILGGDGKISTHVHLRGSLDNPTAKITLAKDIAQAPFRILRRIFTPIDIIVEEIKKGLKSHDYPRLSEESELHNP